MRAAKKRVVRPEAALQTFITRYVAVLEAVAMRVHRLTEHPTALGGRMWVPSHELAEWIAADLPSLYTKTFGRGGALPLKAWRVRNMLSHASYLGAWEALGIQCVRGRGMSSTDRRKKRAHLRVVQ